MKNATNWAKLPASGQDAYRMADVLVCSWRDRLKARRTSRHLLRERLIEERQTALHVSDSLGLDMHEIERDARTRYLDDLSEGSGSK